MKITERTKGSEERQILVAMITNRDVLALISARWQNGMFGSKWSNLVAKWCVDYFKKYRKPPGIYIESIYEKWSNEKQRDRDTTELVEKFLNILSDEHTRKAKRELNAQYVIDRADRYFNEVKIEQLKRKLEEETEAGDYEAAWKAIKDTAPLHVNDRTDYFLFRDKKGLAQSFRSKKLPLIEYPGALGEFFDDVFERDGLVSFEGPEKRGKSWWLFDVVWRAMLDRRNVALFSVGDMSKDQVNRRFAVRASHRPLRAMREYNYPTEIEREDGDDKAQITYKTKSAKGKLNWKEAWSHFQRWSKARHTDTLIRSSIHPSGTISAAGIRGIVEQWENDIEPWAPDIIVIDYADILAPIDPKENKIDQIDETWSYLRRISQELHCCVVTATQTNRESYNAQTLSMKHTANDKRKLAHVTAMIGLNQTADEKEDGIYRLNFVARRENESSERKCVHVASCLSVGNPAVLSTW